MTEPKYPDVKVRLSKTGGNAFDVIVRVHHALMVAGVPKRELVEFLEEAKGGDYGHVLQTCMKWVATR